MGEFHRCSFVHYIPVGSVYKGMLRTVRSLGLVVPKKNGYALTPKGWESIRGIHATVLEDIDKQIDAFVDNL